MKIMIENSPLQNSDKKLTNHYARKTLVKKWGNNSGHNSEAGLDTFDSENEQQKRVISNAIDTVNKDPVHFQRNHSKPWVKNPNFSFLDQKWASPKSKNYHFHNCTVNFYNGENSVQHQNHNRIRKRCAIYSFESSDE